MKYPYPSLLTLKKYGLSKKDWKVLYDRQKGNCACGKPLGDKRIVIDHYHASSWRSLHPNIRKLFVRGLCHWRCNYHFLGRGMDVEVAKNIAQYLQDFEDRKPK